MTIYLADNERIKEQAIFEALKPLGLDVIIIEGGVKQNAESGITRLEINEIISPVRVEENTTEPDAPVPYDDHFSDKKSGICVRTFGDFEVFDSNGVPIEFHYNKTKEMFAYLIDRRGAMCTNREIMAVLWENSPANQHSSYFRNMRKDLLETLMQYGASDIIARGRGTIGVCPDRFECDLYTVIANGGRSAKGRNMYMGEYMSQYSWSETSNSNLYYYLK